MHRWKSSRPAFLAGLFVLLTATFGPGTAEAVTEILAIRTGVEPARTRIVFDLSSTTYEYRRIDESDRTLSILIAGVTPAAGLQDEIRPTGRLEHAIIAREGDAGVVVHFQLGKSSQIKTFTLDGPPRLVVDFKPGAAKAPAERPTKAAPVKQPTPPPAKPPVETKAEVKAQAPTTPPKVNSSPVTETPKAEVPETAAPVVKAAPAPSSPKTFDPIPPQTPPPSTDTIIESTPGPTRGGPRVVVIDAGHGGKDPGAVGEGVREKDVCLDVARSLHKELSARKGYHPILSRSQDVSIPLRQRMRLAEEAGADLFVSVHVNSSDVAEARGVEVFFLSLGGASDETARELAERENDILGETVPAEPEGELPFSLSLRQSDTLLRSSLAAESVLDVFVKKKLAATRGVRQAAFVVLKSYQVPSILVELGFISSAEDRKALKKSNHRTALAQALAEGIDRYFEEFAPTKRTFGAR